MNYLKRFRDAAISVVLLVVPFLFLRANLKDPSEANFLDELLLQASAPVQWLAAKSAHAASGVLEEYVYLVDVRRDNDRLAMENARLREETRRLRGESRENERLRQLLQLKDRLGGEAIAAQVVSKDISAFFRVVRLLVDRGSRDRVRAGMPVVSTQGLVGQVRRPLGRHADVLLTVDSESAVDVVVQRTGARGMLRGTGETNRYRSRIQLLSRDDEVEVGDEIYTSGLGRRFPASILVGRVSRVGEQQTGLFQEVEVTPAVRFGSLEEVLILTSVREEELPSRTEDSE
ncbi:MAG: rod shape-determining protein MreC [Myxococcota bacterium]